METSRPWTIGTDVENDDDEDWEERFARSKGLARPAKPYPDVSDRSTSAEAVRATYSVYWAAKWKLVEISGCEVGTHCSGDCPMPYVAIKASEILSHRGCMNEVTSLAVDSSWNTLLADFCAALGIKTEGMRPAWWLVSDWG